MTVPEILQTTEIETIQVVEIETIQIKDHKTTSTVDHILIFIIINSVIFLEIEAATIRTGQETILSHHIEIILNCQTHKVRTIEAVH